MAALCAILSAATVAAAGDDIPIEIPVTDSGDLVGMETTEDDVVFDRIHFPGGDVAATTPAEGIEINEANFPDANFRNYVLKNKDPNQDGVLSEIEIRDATSISVTYKNVLSLTGIQYFTNMQYLDCYGNQLSELDLSQNTALTMLECNNNQLTKLDLSQNTALTTLYCNQNQLTELDLSQNTALTTLYCHQNQLTELYVSNSTALTTLQCNNNQLTELDVSNNTALTKLECEQNQLTKLNVGNNSALKTLYCCENQLTELDVGNNSALKTLYCYENQLTELDVSHNTALESLSCNGNQLTELDISNNTALKTLYCSNTQLTKLDVSNNTALTTLSCSNTELTNLDLSKNAALTQLKCKGSPITSILFYDNIVPATFEHDCVMKDKAITKDPTCTEAGEKTIQCVLCGREETAPIPAAHTYGENGRGVCTVCNLLPIDDKNFPDRVFRAYIQNDIDTDNNGFLSEEEIAAVTELLIYGLNPAIADMTGIEYFTSLQTLNFRDNKVTKLDVSKNTELTNLKCDGNQLSTLDVSHNTKLDYLNCNNNQLTTLDVSNNLELTTLYCNNNQLTTLDVSHNTKLDYLNCSNNQLTTLDVSNKPELSTLYCNDNELTTLDVSGDTTLRDIECTNNQLTTLDLSQCTEELSSGRVECKGNPLTEVKFDPNVLSSLLTFKNFIHDCNEDITIEEIPATCTTAGKTAGKTCTLCKNVTTPTEIPALGHTPEEVESVEPTCGVPGHTAGTKCSVCGEWLTGEVISAAGAHTFLEEGTYSKGKGACTVCGAVAITGDNFTDNVFMEYIKTAISDKYDDVYLTPEKIASVTKLEWNADSNYNNFNNLGGIEYFTNLEELSCRLCNSVQRIDVSKNDKLRTVNIDNCSKLAELYLGSGVVEANCYYNSLRTVDVSKASSLKMLNISSNSLPYNFALTGCTSLEELYISGNSNLYSVDLTGCSNLKLVDCTGCSYISEFKLPEGFVVTDKSLVHDHNEIPEYGKEPTCKEPGSTERIYCGICGKVTQESEPLPILTDHSGLDFYCSGCGKLPVNAKTFPDEAFRNSILEMFSLTDSADPMLTDDDVSGTTSISLADVAAENLTGIEYFNSLASLSLSGTSLTGFSVPYEIQDSLKEVTLENNASITALNFDSCRLDSIVCRNNSGLESFSANYSSYLKTIVCTDNANLTGFSANQNDSLTKVTCTGNTKMTGKYSDYNAYFQIKENEALTEIDCSGNGLTKIHLIESNPVLEKVVCSGNKLTELTLNFGLPALNYVDCTGNPGLETVTFDEGVTPATFLHDHVFVDGKCKFCGLEAVAIDQTNFPDEIFRTYISNNFDIDKDNALTQDECDAVDVIFVQDKSINTLQGIKFFTKLKRLMCASNEISEIDLSENKEIYYASCQDNPLKTINVSGCALLKYITFFNCDLTTLDIADCTLLESLDCRMNDNLTEITFADGVLKRLLDTKKFAHYCNSVDLPAIEPTCGEPGREAGTGCSLCGKGPAEIPATGAHIYENGICTGCNQPIPTYTVTLSTDGNCTIEAVIVDAEGRALSEEEGGTIVHSGDKVPEGTVLQVTATAKDGYVLVTWPKESPYTITGDLTLEATAAPKTYTLTVNHTNGAAPTVEGCADLNAVPRGTKVKLTAGEAEAEYEFIGWYQTNGKKLSGSTTYEVTVNGDTTVEARYQAKSGVVTFMANDQIEGTFSGGTFTENDYPKNPTTFSSFRFTGWDKTVDEINAALNAGTNITVTALYETIKQEYKVTIYNGEKDEPEVVTLNESKYHKVKAEAVEGKNFAYWMMDGSLITYNQTANVLVVADCELKAVYSTVPTEAMGTALLKSATYNADAKELVMVAYLTVPEGTTINSAGLVAASSAFSGYDSNTELTKANAQYLKESSLAVGKSAPVTYTWTKTNVAIGDVWYARAYVTYTDGSEEKTVYSDRLTVTAGQDYDSSERATAKITSCSYNPSTSEAVFVSYTTVPEGAVISKSGLVASSSADFNAAESILTAENAKYVRVSSLAVGKSAPVTFTWTKTKVNSGDIWYVRAYLVYTLNNVEHTVYGELVEFSAQ